MRDVEQVLGIVIAKMFKDLWQKFAMWNPNWRYDFLVFKNEYYDHGWFNHYSNVLLARLYLCPIFMYPKPKDWEKDDFPILESRVKSIEDKKIQIKNQHKSIANNIERFIEKNLQLLIWRL